MNSLDDVTNQAAANRVDALIAEFQKGRNGATVRVSLREFDGRAFVDVEDFRPASGGGLEPTPRSKITIGVHLLAKLSAAIEKAGQVARKRGAS